MHCNNFSSRIYVEKTSEHCSFNHHHSRIAKEDGWWDRYSSGGLDNEQVYDQDSVKKKLYNVKELPERKKGKLREKKEKKRIIVALKVVLALKLNCSNNNSPPRTFILSSFIGVFLCSSFKSLLSVNPLTRSPALSPTL